MSYQPDYTQLYNSIVDDAAMLMVPNMKDDIARLKSLGYEVDLLFPKKISGEVLNEIFEELDTDTVHIKDLLTAKGFVANLDFQMIYLPPSKFKLVDFSGMSLVCSTVFLNKTKVSFEDANLENAAIVGYMLDDDSINFNQANLVGLSGIINDKLYQSLPIEQTAESHLMVVPEVNFFDQHTLIATFGIEEIIGEGESAGESWGLVYEYGRYAARYAQKGLSEDVDAGFRDKIERKLKEPIGNMAGRIHTYENIYTKKYDNAIELDLTSAATLLESLSVLNNADLVFLNASNRHAMALRVIKDSYGDINGYKIFDPESRISSPLNSAEELRQELSKILIFYSKLYQENIKFFAEDLGKLVLEFGLISNDAASYNKDSKNIHLLFSALKTGDIEAIKSLSAAQKIDVVGVGIPFDSDGETLHYFNILKFAIYTSSEEALVALINSNTKLDLSANANTMFILKHLMLAGNLSQAVLDALSQKAEELGAVEAGVLINSARNIQSDINEKHLMATICDTDLMDQIAKSFEDSSIDYTIEGSVLHATIDPLSYYSELTLS